MAIIHLNENNFEEIKGTDKTVLIDFYADWCGPCRMVAPIIEAIAEERTDIVVCKVNVDDEQGLAQAFNVTSIPTLAVLKNGKLVRKESGARPKSDILAMLD